MTDARKQALEALRERRILDANYRDRDIVWNAAVEECAKAAENTADPARRRLSDYDQGAYDAADKIAAAIRALASSPDGQK